MIRAEFEDSLGDPIGFWGEKSINDIKIMLGGSVAGIVNFQQRNPHHCYDLLTHSLYTVAGIKDTAPALLRVAKNGAHHG